MGFTPYKAKQPLRGTELQKKSKKDYCMQEIYQNNEWTSLKNNEVGWLSQFKLTYTKVIPREKTSAGYISTISQGLKTGSK